MKILQARHKLLLLTVVTSLIIGLVLLAHHLSLLNAIYRTYWISLLPVLMIIFSPLGSKKLAVTSDEKPTYKPSAWILRIITLELATLIIFFGICHLSGVVLPTFIPPIHLFSLSLHHTLFTVGLFPWTIVAVLSVMIGYYSYSQQQDAYFSTLFHPLFRTTNDNTLGLIINTSARTATLFTFSSAIAFTVLLIISLFFSPADFATFSGFTSTNIIFFTILIIATSNRLIKRPIHILTVKYRLHPFTACVAIILFLTIFVTVLHLFFGDAFNTTLKTPHYVSLLLQQQWLANWHLFTIFWWLTCTPILAVFIARLSRGYSWRATIIATLALPIIIALALLWQPFFHVLNAMDNMPSWLAVLISVAGLLIFIVFIARKQMFSSVMHTYLPRVDTIKYRNPDRFINHVLQFTTIMLCIYLATGILLLNVLFVVFLLIFSLVLIFLPLALLLTFTRAVKNISSNI